MTRSTVEQLNATIWIHPREIYKIYDWVNDEYNMNQITDWDIDNLKDTPNCALLQNGFFFPVFLGVFRSLSMLLVCCMLGFLSSSPVLFVLGLLLL